MLDFKPAKSLKNICIFQFFAVPLQTENKTKHHAMMKKKGIINVYDGSADINELQRSVDKLSDGEYAFFIFDNSKNRSLPQLKYLFGVVLKTISQKLDSHPSPEALYRYFEEVYAPIHKSNIQGEEFEYFDLKNEKSIELDNVIEMIIQHATDQWGIKIPTKEEIREAEAREPYAEAYAETWKFLSQN